MAKHTATTTPLTFADIRAGDTVTIRAYRHGGFDIVSGRAVIVDHQRGTVALNMGGRYGRPGLATESNFVSLRKARKG